MKGNLTSDDFLNFTAEIVELGENALNQTDDLVSATNDVQTYINEIKNATDEQTDQLNKLLISALATINFELDCLRSKLSIIATLALNCARGTNDFDTLFIDAKNAEEKEVTESCIRNNYMTKPEIKNITEENMLLQNKQVICIRNNQGKKDFVCSQWYLDIDNNTIESQVLGATLADVEYFISECPPGDVREIQITAICSQKATNFASPADVIETFWKFNSTQVQNTYDSCSLNQLQKDDICAKKQNLFTVEQIQGIYMYYPAEMVTTVLNTCQQFANLDDSPADKNMMCNFQNTPGFEYGSPGSQIFWNNFIEIYGTEQIEAHIQTCSPVGDSVGVGYNNNQQMSDILNSEMERYVEH